MGVPVDARLVGEVERGATAEPLTERDAFIAAAARNDATEAARLLEDHREYLDYAQPLVDAAGAGNVGQTPGQKLEALGLDEIADTLEAAVSAARGVLIKPCVRRAAMQ